MGAMEIGHQDAHHRDAHHREAKILPVRPLGDLAVVAEILPVRPLGDLAVVAVVIGVETRIDIGRPPDALALLAAQAPLQEDPLPVGRAHQNHQRQMILMSQA